MPDLGYVPLEVGPLARQMMAARPDAADFQDADPLIKNLIDELGPSVMTRVLARMHEAPKYFRNVQRWLKELDLHGEFYVKPQRAVFRQGLRCHRGGAGRIVRLDRARGRQDRQLPGGHSDRVEHRSA